MYSAVVFTFTLTGGNNIKTSVHLLNPHYTQTVQHRESHNIIRSLPT